MKIQKSLYHTLFSFLFLFLLSYHKALASDSMGERGEEGEDSFYIPSTSYPVTFPKGHKWLRAKATGERVDLTNLPFITIDPQGAEDLDDALYVDSEKGGGYHVAIAIADPTYYVYPDSPIAQEARRRSFTIYGYGAPIPMLPPKLVQACSLEQNKKRPALVIDLYIDENGNFQDTPTIYKALIRSQNRLSYDYVNGVYEGDSFDITPPSLKKRLFLTQQAAQSLKAYYSENWAVMSSQDVVNEFMTTANNAAAIILKKRIKNSLIEKAVFRTQDEIGSRALYSSKSSFHASFDLTYTHVTSPIRRYADMMVHWLLFHPGYKFSESTLEYINHQQEKIG